MSRLQAQTTILRVTDASLPGPAAEVSAWGCQLEQFTFETPSRTAPEYKSLEKKPQTRIKIILEFEPPPPPLGGGE